MEKLYQLQLQLKFICKTHFYAYFSILVFLELVLESDANYEQFEETKRFPSSGISFTRGIKFRDSSNTMPLLA